MRQSTTDRSLLAVAKTVPSGEKAAEVTVSLADEILTSDFVSHIPHFPDAAGLEGYKEEVVKTPTTVTGFHATIEDMIAEGDKVVGRLTAAATMQPFGVPYTNTWIIIFRFAGGQIAEEDKVVVRWTWSGTHTGEFMGIPPTGRQITVTGISIHRFADGKFVESWASYDSLGMMLRLTTREWPIAGAWINIVPIPDLGNITGVLTISPQDSNGANFTSVLRAGKAEATVFGAFPDADHQSDHIGQLVKTGLNTYESSAIGYGTKKSEMPGMLPEIVYISVLYAKMQLTDENTMKGQGTHAFYAPF